MFLLLAFQGDYSHFVQAFLKRFAPLDTTEAARDALKALKQGKNSGQSIFHDSTSIRVKPAGQTPIIAPGSTMGLVNSSKTTWPYLTAPSPRCKS